MKNLGFIGFGSMAGMFVNGFIKSGRIKQANIIVTRKDKSRLDEIKSLWPDIGIAQDPAEVARKAERIFICVKPLDYKDVLFEIKSYILPDHHLISTTGLVEIGTIEKIVSCRITKVQPTITSEVGEGISLVCHNSKVTDADRIYIESLLGSICKTLHLDEADFGFASEITSCGPGLIAAIYNEFVKAGLRHSESLCEEEIIDMLVQTIYGTARLMTDRRMSFGDIVARVATKGGVTEEGVNVIEKSLCDVFDYMFYQTAKKRKDIGEMVNGMFT